MFDWLAEIFGRRVVYLLDFDGEVTKRWAKETPFGLTCTRFERHVLLLPDGTIRGPSYTKAWAESNPVKFDGDDLPK
jgi:hypothetical protein